MFKETVEHEKTVTEIIEEVTEKICDEYCKWPEYYSKLCTPDEAFDNMEHEKCDGCPLMRL